MKVLNGLAMGFALVASPIFAQTPAAPHEDRAECEKMKSDEECKHECCEKDADGKMVCKMMDHAKMDHSKMDHSKMDHAKMDHAKNHQPAEQKPAHKHD